MDLQYLLNGAVDVVLTWRLGVKGFNREGPTRNGEGRSVAVKFREFLGVHRGRGNYQFEVSSTREDCLCEQTKRI